MAFLASLLLCVFALNLDAGTNAAVTFNTNTFLISPSGIWASNAAAIEAAITNSGGTNNLYNPTQFNTNGSSQITIYALPASNLAGIFSNANFGLALATLNSNLDSGLTNAAGQTIEQRVIASTNTINAATLTNLSAALATLNSNLDTSVTNGAGQTIEQRVNASTNAINAATLTNTVPVAALTNIPLAALAVAPLTNGQTAAWTNKTNEAINGGLTVSNASTFHSAVTVSNLTINNSLNGGPPSGSSVLDFANGSFLSENQFGPSELTVSGLVGLILTGNGLGVTIGDYINGAAVMSSLSAQNGVISNNLTDLGVFYPSQIQSGTYTGTNNWTGDIAYPNAAITTLVNGNNAGLIIGTNTEIILSGPTAAFSIVGIAGGRDGRNITLINPTGYAMTIANNSGIDPFPTNRIATGQNADIIFSNTPAYVSLHYVGASNMWQVQSFNAVSSSTLILPTGLITNGNAAAVTISNNLTSTSNITAVTHLGATNLGDYCTNASGGHANAVQYYPGSHHSASGCVIQLTNTSYSVSQTTADGNSVILLTNYWPTNANFTSVPAVVAVANEYLENDIAQALVNKSAAGGFLGVDPQLSTTTYCVVTLNVSGGLTASFHPTTTNDMITLVVGASQ